MKSKKVNLATVVVGDPKAPFSLATTPSRLFAGRPGFSLRSSHTKNSKNGT